MAARVVLSVLLAAAAVAGVAAHGGVLHQDGTPATKNYARTKVASCSKWVGVRNTPPAARVEGAVDVFQYLYKNCSLAPGEKPSAGIAINVTLRDAQTRAPLAAKSLDGIATQTGCVDNDGEPVVIDPAAENEAHARLWFTNATVNATGVVFGTGANDGEIVTSGPGAPRAVLLVNRTSAGSGVPLACCDLVLAGPATTNWSKTLPAGVNCSEGDDDNKTADALASQPKAAAAKSGAGAGAAAAGALSVVSAVLALLVVLA